MTLGEPNTWQAWPPISSTLSTGHVTEAMAGDERFDYSLKDAVFFNGTCVFEQGPEFIRNRTNTAEEHTTIYHTVQTSTTHGPIEHRASVGTQ